MIFPCVAGSCPSSESSLVDRLVGSLTLRWGSKLWRLPGSLKGTKVDRDRCKALTIFESVEPLLRWVLDRRKLADELFRAVPARTAFLKCSGSGAMGSRMVEEVEPSYLRHFHVDALLVRQLDDIERALEEQSELDATDD